MVKKSKTNKDTHTQSLDELSNKELVDNNKNSENKNNNESGNDSSITKIPNSLWIRKVRIATSQKYNDEIIFYKDSPDLIKEIILSSNKDRPEEYRIVCITIKLFKDYKQNIALELAKKLYPHLNEKKLTKNAIDGYYWGCRYFTEHRGQTEEDSGTGLKALLDDLNNYEDISAIKEEIQSHLPIIEENFWTYFGFIDNNPFTIPQNNNSNSNK